MRESPLSPLFQNRACGFPRTRLLSYCALVMGTLHLRRDLVVTVSMDEHKIVPLVVLMVSISVVNLYDVL